MDEIPPQDILNDPALKSLALSQINTNEAKETESQKDLEQLMPDIVATQQCGSPTRILLKEGVRGRQQSFSDVLNVNKQESWINVSVERDLIRELEASQRKPAQLDKSSLQKSQVAPSLIQFQGVEGRRSDAKLLPASLSLSEDLFHQIGNKKRIKPACALCKKGGKQISLGDQEGGSKTLNDTTEQENLLIYPCLCSFMAHRECLRAYVLSTNRPNCEKCQVFYALGSKERRIPIQKQTKVLAGLFVLIICLIVSLGATIAGIVILSNSNQNLTLDSQIRYFWLIVDIICGIMVITIWIFAIIRVINSHKKKQIIDILVYCKQCEVAKHTQASDEILKKFLEQEEKRGNSHKLVEAKKIHELQDVDGFNEAMKSRDYFEGVYHHRSNYPLDIKYDLESLLVSHRGNKHSLNKTSSYFESNTIDINEGSTANRVLNLAKRSSNVFTSWTAGDLLTPSKEGTKNKIHVFNTVSHANTNSGLLISNLNSPQKEGGDNIVLKMNTWESVSSAKKLESRKIPQKDFSLLVKERQMLEEKANNTCELRETEAAEYI